MLASLIKCHLMCLMPLHYKASASNVADVKTKLALVKTHTSRINHWRFSCFSQQTVPRSVPYFLMFSGIVTILERTPLPTLRILHRKSINNDD